MIEDPNKFVMDYCRELFARLEEFFIRATGRTAMEFASVESFRQVIQSSSQDLDLAYRGRSAFVWLDNEVRWSQRIFQH